MFPLHTDESSTELKQQVEESKSIKQHQEIGNAADSRNNDGLEPVLKTKTKSNRESPRNRAESSSNYDASIFEDEISHCSSDNMVYSDKDEARRSLGTATPMGG